MQEGSEDAISDSFDQKPAVRQQATSKEIPARCKCGEHHSFAFPATFSPCTLLPHACSVLYSLLP